MKLPLEESMRMWPVVWQNLHTMTKF